MPIAERQGDFPFPGFGHDAGDARRFEIFLALAVLLEAGEDRHPCVVPIERLAVRRHPLELVKYAQRRVPPRIRIEAQRTQRWAISSRA